MSRDRPGITGDVRAAFDDCLVHADEEGAVALTVRLLQDGVRAEDILLGLVAPAQQRVGTRWASGEWTVAQEHGATHVSERSVATVAAATPEPGPAGTAGAVLVTCSDGEWHTLPARLLAEVLRVRGFHVRFLGGHVPAAQLVSDLHQNAPDVVALSCTLPMRLPLAHGLIQVCRPAGVPVLAGGCGFGPDGTWAYALGADLYAPDAPTADTLLRRQWPPPLTGEPSLDAGSTEAYAHLARHRSALLRHVVQSLHDRFPDLRDPTHRQDEATTETLGQLLDSLAAGAFVDDPRVFIDYLSFAAAFLTARATDPARLLAVLDFLAAPLSDSPHLARHLAAGRTWLDTHLTRPSAEHRPATGA
ncbi:MULTISPECIES: B12-binding domain-containing protein [unclassified Streptomyces]|uniref:cobalamin B12-binding domain-containing protein n=1 Tax=unclassified Streptomyces TaxID=2593676 RepID=UPI0037F65E3E